MSESNNIMLPLPTNRESNRDWDLFAPFWEGTRNGELKVQQCTETKKKVWPPRFLSPYAPGAPLEWVNIEGKGEVYTFSIVHRAFTPYYQDKVPHTLVVVELEDNVRMLGQLVGMDDPTKVECGMKMEMEFEKVDDDITLVHWKPVERG